MNKLKELRKEKGLTQQELANIMGVTRRGYQKWENGESQIKPDKAQQLADYFGVTVGYLLGYSDYPELGQVVTHIHDQYPSDIAWKVSPLSKFGEDFIPMIKERYGEEVFNALVNLLAHFTFDPNSSKLEGLYKYFLLEEDSQQAINNLILLLFDKDYKNKNN